MAGFIFRLERTDGSPADPPTFEASRPDWPVGTEVITRLRRLRVVGHRDDGADQPPVLIVEDV
jgi:hypothetical protein